MTPSLDYHRTRFREAPKWHDGVAGLIYRVSRFRRCNPLARKALLERAVRIDQRAHELSDLSGAELNVATEAFRGEARLHGDYRKLDLEEALATIVVCAERSLKLRAYPEQIMAALALLDGFLAEVDTGEGKTMAIALAAVFPGWTGRPMHVITANDYLAERDAENLAAFYRAAGLTVGAVTGEMDPPVRRENYRRDITYTTAKELAADVLRDQLQEPGVLRSSSCRLVRSIVNPAFQPSVQRVLRGLHTAFVDEADNGLIDEAVTPLIISQARENPDLVEACRLASNLAKGLDRDLDFLVLFAHKEIRLTELGEERIKQNGDRFPGFWQGERRRRELVLRAIEAREFYKKDQQYVIHDRQIVIVDEATGRPMPQRTWKQGLHQAIEAKEGIPISAPSETISSMSFQRFFRLFHHLAGTSGTIREATVELWRIYGLPVIKIPRHLPLKRAVLPPRISSEIESKWTDVIAEVRDIHATRRPILIGTRSVKDSEDLSISLLSEGISCVVLNATRHAEEADIVAEAGRESRITIATNMAGRGTDIHVSDSVIALGGLHVIATERHESGRVDRQLYGRAARQGNPGAVRQFASLEDELVLKHLPKRIRNWLKSMLVAGVPGANSVALWLVNRCQKRAEKVSYSQRQRTLSSETGLDEALGFAKEH